MALWPETTVTCPDRDDHRGPEGPNEDLGQCRKCGSPGYSKRPAGETFGLHADDCSLEVDHPSYCQPGGDGHPPAEKIRGWWPGFDQEILDAIKRWDEKEKTE